MATNMLEPWQQDLFDLMANKRIELTITGVFGEVDGELKVEGPNGMREVASTIGAEDWQTAIKELMEKHAAQKTTSRSRK